MSGEVEKLFLHHFWSNDWWLVTRVMQHSLLLAKEDHTASGNKMINGREFSRHAGERDLPGTADSTQMFLIQRSSIPGFGFPFDNSSKQILFRRIECHLRILFHSILQQASRHTNGYSLSSIASIHEIFMTNKWPNHHLVFEKGNLPEPKY